MSLTDAILTESGGMRGLEAGSNRVREDYTPVVKADTLIDNFAAAIDKSVKWKDSSAAVVWEAGQAKIPCTSSYWALQTGLSVGQAYDLTASSVYAKITPPTNGNNSREVTFSVHAQGGDPLNNRILFLWQSGTLVCRKVNNSTVTDHLSVSYDPTNHAWLRMREASGTVYWDRSPDGTTWTNIASTTAPTWALTKVAVGFGSGYWGTESASDAYIDNVNTSGVGPPVPLAVWDAGTLVASNGDPIGTWEDSTTNNLDATTTGSARPTYVASGLGGLPALSFDGVDDYFTLPSGFSDWTAGLTWFIVAKPTTATAGGKILLLSNGTDNEVISISRNGTGTQGTWFSVNASHETLYFFTSNDWYVANEPAIYSTHIAAGAANASVAGSVRKNNTVWGGQNLYVPPVVARSTNYIGRSVYGGDGFWAGEISEIRLYNVALSDTDRDAVYAELDAKYRPPPIGFRTFTRRDYVDLAIAEEAAVNFDGYTMAALVRHTDFGETNTWMSMVTAGGAATNWYVYIGTAGPGSQEVDAMGGSYANDGINAATNVTPTGEWYIVAVSRVAGSGNQAVRFHKYRFSTGVWTHVGGSSPVIPSVAVGAGGFIRIGAPSHTGESYAGDIAAALFERSVLTDVQIESLPRGFSNWVALADHAWRLDAATVVDAVGNCDQVAIDGAPLGIGSSPLPAVVTPTGTWVTDNFNRANGAPGSNWILSSSNFVIVSNRLVGGQGRTWMATPCTTTNQVVEVDYDASAGEACISICGDGAVATGYKLFVFSWATGYAELQRNDAQVQTYGSAVHDGASTYRLRLEKNGNRIRAWVGPTLAIDYTDGSPLTGRFYVGLHGNDAAGTAYDNFVGGDL